jgi:hypothetical protein
MKIFSGAQKTYIYGLDLGAHDNSNNGRLQQSALRTDQAMMHVSSRILLAGLLFGSLSHASAIPSAEHAYNGIHARHGDYPYGRGLTNRADGPDFWMETIKHQGASPFGPSGYTVFRNVKDFGAKGTCESALTHPNTHIYPCTDN